ncbi:hypothetical protein Tco_1024630 [Tanacetum coccineum]
MDHHHLVASPAVVLDRIMSFPRGTSCGRDGLCAQHLMDCLSGTVVAISDEVVSTITQVVNLYLDGKCPNRLGEYIVNALLTPWLKPGGDIRPIALGTNWRRLVSKVSAIMIGHSLDGYLDGLEFGVGVAGGSEAILHSVNAWYLDDGTIVGDTMVVGKVLELIIEDGPGCGLHLNVDKTEVFLAKGRPSKQACKYFST